MIRRALALVLSLALAVAGLVLSQAEGASHDIGVQIAICSGTTVTLITVGPDGQPVKTTEPCPKGSAIFAATFGLPALPAPEPKLIAMVAPPLGAARADVPEFVPSARGPPLPV